MSKICYLQALFILENSSYAVFETECCNSFNVSLVSMIIMVILPYVYHLELVSLLDNSVKIGQVQNKNATFFDSWDHERVEF